MTGHARVNYFELVEENNESLLMFDPHKRTIKIYWNGTVEEETAKTILNTGTDMIEEGKVDRILLSREFLSEFSTEARNWIKDDLLKTRGQSLVSKIYRVATVKPTSTIGNVFSALINSSIKLLFPDLKMKQFINEVDATEWLLSD